MSRKTLPTVILDVANLKSTKNFKELFPAVSRDFKKSKIRTASGGSKFKRELKGTHTFVALFNELARAGLLIKINDSIADKEVQHFEHLIQDEFNRKLTECDDPHLFSLVKLTNAKTLISFDKNISKCRRCLRSSNIDNHEFSNPKRVECNRSYLKLYNNKSL